MIEATDKARLGELASAALDRIEREYGDEANLEDAVLVYEVSLPLEDDPTERTSQLMSDSTSFRATVTAGMLNIEAANLSKFERLEEDE